MKKLVVVESPTKARTIRAFLPAGYDVLASMGHVRDLPSSASEIPTAAKDKEWSRLGVNVEDGFRPLYVISPSYVTAGRRPGYRAARVPDRRVVVRSGHSDKDWARRIWETDHWSGTSHSSHLGGGQLETVYGQTSQKRWN